MKKKNNDSVRYVKYKHNMNNKKDLENEDKCINFVDRAVYVYLRKFMNKDTYTTFVSLDKISRDFGLTRPTVTKSIEKLIDQGHLLKEKRGRGYEYYFTDRNPKKFEMISYELLNKDIPPKLKAFCISMQEYMINKETGIGICKYNPSEMSKNLGMSYNSYKKYIGECKKWGLISGDFNSFIDLKDKPLEFNLEKLGQAILFVNKKVDKTVEDLEIVKEVVEQLRENSAQQKEKIEQLNAEVKELKKEKEELEKEKKRLLNSK